jgi:hypothetical protein
LTTIVAFCHFQVVHWNYGLCNYTIKNGQSKYTSNIVYKIQKEDTKNKNIEQYEFHQKNFGIFKLLISHTCVLHVSVLHLSMENELDINFFYSLNCLQKTPLRNGRLCTFIYFLSFLLLSLSEPCRPSLAFRNC